MKSVLFVAYGGGHVAMLAPIASALLEAKRPFVFLALTTARATLDSLSIPSIGFRDLTGAMDMDVQAWGRILADELPDGGSVSFEESVSYLGLNFRELVQDVGEVEAWKRYRTFGRHSFLPVRTMEHAISMIKPDVVVTTNSPRVEQAAILAARRLSIPSICAVDLFALQEIQWIGKPNYADCICVLNEQVRDFFLDNGRQPEEVIVTGNPAFDALNDPIVEIEGYRLREKRGWNDGLINILWASQIEPESHPFSSLKGDPMLPRNVEQELRKFIASNSQYRLIVRYHPSENVSFEPDERVDFSPNIEPIEPLLHAVDIVVVTASTVGLQASIVGKPVFSIDQSIFTSDTLYSRMGISVGLDHVDGLQSELLRLCISPGSLKQPLRRFKNFAPTSTQRLLSVINSFL